MKGGTAASIEEEAKRFEENEETYLLRVPPHIAQQIRSQLKSEEQDNDEKEGNQSSGNHQKQIPIQFQRSDDGRSVLFQFGNEELIGKFLDIPTVMEVQKTYDKVNYYKTADIGQMLYVWDPMKENERDHSFYDEKKIMNSGLTPPTKNIRKRKFRKELDNRKREEISAAQEEMLRLMKGGVDIIDNDEFEVLALEYGDKEEIQIEDTQSSIAPEPTPLTITHVDTPQNVAVKKEKREKKHKREKKEKKGKKEKREKKNKKEKRHKKEKKEETQKSLEPPSHSSEPLLPSESLEPVFDIQSFDEPESVISAIDTELQQKEVAILSELNELQTQIQQVEENIKSSINQVQSKRFEAKKANLESRLVSKREELQQIQIQINQT